jgi:molybdate transport system permease protein
MNHASQPHDAATAGRYLGSAGWVLVSLTGLFLLLAVGPLLGLFLYTPLPQAIRGMLMEEAWQALLLTLWTSAIAVSLAVVLGLPAAICLARVDFRGKVLVNALIELPIALPPLVLGVALILVWGRQGLLGHFLAEAGHPISFTPLAVIAAQFVVASPFFVRIAKAAIEQVPASLEEASITLGRSLPATLMLVTLPLAGRGLLSALITCWARAMGEFGATILFAGSFPGRTQTAPTAIFTLMQHDVESAVGLALIMLAFSAVAFMVAQMGVRRLTTAGGMS